MFRNPLSVGVDIGNHSIKAVVLQQKKEQFELVAFAEVELTKTVINDQHSVNNAELLSAMRQIKKQLPWQAKVVTLALPDSAVISKVVQLGSNLSEEEAEFAITQALGAASPFPVEELWFDYFPLISDRFSDVAATTPFQVFASRRETIDNRVNALLKLGFKPKVMELQTHALLWLAEHFAEMGSHYNQWGVVDVGKRHTEFCMKPQGSAVYHREIRFGTSMFDSLDGVTQFGGNHAEQFTKRLAEQLKRQIQLYNSTHPRSGIKGLWLGGGGQNLVSASLLQRLIGLDTVWVSPFQHFSCAKKVELPRMMSSQYAVATGLALRGLA
ncbi:type IV pilus biogenesis protein PilM [Photobacterium kishitanii]|uniref:Pilus assembly protein PilM n=1 Tax=Photobacterium kishitanii TaxID=318456 RepID=A0A0B7J938_9GAMM|nr:type IV pilus assembly protein PilM [Photobacterium kishitanii]PSU98693.1 pilus assembly protein PilM [Photobacterium kishitanii]PSV19855.1 pilus assembly protein PilM [Photobacterium kishitanii]CEO37922.1 Type IV pilus assembly PilM family protein [Photobacterium kishitanii]